MTVGLVACSNDNENEKDPDITIGDDENKEDDNKEDDDKGESGEPDKEDFTLQTKDNGLSAEKGSYLFWVSDFVRGIYGVLLKNPFFYWKLDPVKNCTK